MSNLILFTPKHEQVQRANLVDFISLVEESYPQLNDEIEYESYYWPKVGNFTKIGVSSRNKGEENRLHPSIIPFAKAYVAYSKTHNRSRNTNQLYALRAIEAACIEAYGEVDIAKLGVIDFDRAAQAAKDGMGGGAAYQAGAHLKKLHTFLIEKRIIEPFLWKNPIKKPAEITTVGDKAEKRRQEKMPDDNALIALAEIFAQKDEDLSPRDVFTTSTMALMYCAPERGSEPIYLSTDCIHKESMTVERAMECGYTLDELNALVQARNDAGKYQTEQKKVSLTVTDSIELYGLKWFSGKNYGYANKWLPTVMIDTALRAVERLLVLSKEAREFAKMLECSEGFPRHRLCPDVDEDTLLTKDEAVSALGLDVSMMTKKKASTSGNQLLKKHGIERKDYQVCLRDLNSIIRQNLPEGFPYIPFSNGNGMVKVRWSESLYAGLVNNFNCIKSTIYTELTIPTVNTINEDLAPTKKKNRKTGDLATGNLSLFQRWGYGDLSMTSHQLRHMLDTIANVNGMEGEVRAKWAQRSDPKHNRFYDHTTHEEYGEDFIVDQEKQLSIQQQNEKSEVCVQWYVATPRTIQELNTKASLSAHTTEFGMCISSYLSEPCEKYRDCINCNEHVCEKGDDSKCERIRQRLEREEHLLRKDKQALDDGVNGAQQWYRRRSVTVGRCKELINMMNDPNIANGALIKLADVEDISLLDRAMDANGNKRLPKIKNHNRVQYLEVDEFVGGEVVELEAEIEDMLEFGVVDALEDFL
ncbi:integrase [Vibrio parahaemolyticus]